MSPLEPRQTRNWKKIIFINEQFFLFNEQRLSAKGTQPWALVYISGPVIFGDFVNLKMEAVRGQIFKRQFVF